LRHGAITALDDFTKPANRQLSYRGGTPMPTHAIGQDEQQPLSPLIAQIERRVVIFLSFTRANDLARPKLPSKLRHAIWPSLPQSDFTFQRRG
jgi:hypothetical protein